MTRKATPQPDGTIDVEPALVQVPVMIDISGAVLVEPLTIEGESYKRLIFAAPNGFVVRTTLDAEGARQIAGQLAGGVQLATLADLPPDGRAE